MTLLARNVPRRAGATSLTVTISADKGRLIQRTAVEFTLALLQRTLRTLRSLHFRLVGFGGMGVTMATLPWVFLDRNLGASLLFRATHLLHEPIHALATGIQSSNRVENKIAASIRLTAIGNFDWLRLVVLGVPAVFIFLVFGFISFSSITFAFGIGESQRLRNDLTSSVEPKSVGERMTITSGSLENVRRQFQCQLGRKLLMTNSREHCQL